jgi:transcriptional regulatory protein LevR
VIVIIVDQNTTAAAIAGLLARMLDTQVVSSTELPLRIAPLVLEEPETTPRERRWRADGKTKRRPFKGVR